MTTGAKDSPASLYGVVSLVFGTIALIIALWMDVYGAAISLICGGLAVTLATLGLIQRVNRAKCAIGLSTGGIALLYLAYVLVTF
jgi:hypothetical protein